VPGGCDDFVDLVAGQFTAFSGFGSLGDFYLQFVGIGEIPTGHTKPSRGDLLDVRTLGILIWLGLRFLWIEMFKRLHHERVLVFRPVVPLEPLGIFTALTGVAFATEYVHRHREGFVGLCRD
jgi:hypothetical protein